MAKNILITGGTGFVGSNFINLYRNQYNFINLGRGENISCKNVFWDLRSELDYKTDKNIDAVIHCASIVGNSRYPKSEYIDINLRSTLELLEYCVKNNIKKFIYISTGGVYGYNKEKVKEDAICNPIDIYGMSKYFSEKLCDLYKDKLTIVILRLFFPYGNGQAGRLLTNLTNSIVNNKEITLNKGGLPIINPIHVFDVVNIINKVIEKDCSGIFNVSGDEYISLENLCRKIAFHAKIDNLKFVYNNNDITNLAGTNEKVCKLLNYKISTDLDAGIKMYLKSLKCYVEKDVEYEL